MKFFKRFDFLPHKATLTFNQKGEIGYKTFIGGIISILCIFCSFSFCLYFLYRMFYRKDLSVIHSTQINPYVNLTDSHKLPFLLRLTDTNSNAYEEDEKLYYITASIWYGGSNDTSLSGIAPQFSVSLNVSKCDINKHFTDEFRDYFKNFTDLNSYYCLEPRNYSQTIYGLYGNIYPFSYYSFTARYCKNTTENNNSCYSVEESKKKFDYMYLDVIFIDYTIDSLKIKNVNEIFIRKERYELSTILFKRVWLYFENIKYVINKGYIFSDEENEYFHGYESVRSDFNIFDDKPIIVTLTILNGMKTSIYIKQFTKFQDYVAIMGGLVKVITLISTILNYYNAENSYYLKLIKDFIIVNKYKHSNSINQSNNNINSNLSIVNNNDDKSKKTPFHLTSSLNPKTKNAHGSIDFTSKNDSGLILNKKIPKLDNSFHILNTSLSTKFLPSFFAKKKYKETLILYKEFINNRLNIINILKKLEMIQINNEVINKNIPVSPNPNFVKEFKKKINNYIKET